MVDSKPVAALVRGDRELNEIKLKNYFKADEVVLASPEQVTQWTNARWASLVPWGFTAGPIVADHELMADTDWIAGANKADTHILHVDLKRDVPAFAYADLRSIAEGTSAPPAAASRWPSPRVSKWATSSSSAPVLHRP